MKIMDKMNPKDIKTHPTFRELFPIKPEILKSIEEDMKAQLYGFDPAQPVILATWEGQGEPVCLDGHTRIQAAINVGIKEIPVWVCEFDAEQEAFEHSIHLQCNRRNLSDAERYRYFEMVDKRNPQERNPATGQFTRMQDCNPGKSAERTAELLNTSPRKVSQMRTIADHANPEVREAVRKGEKTINRGYEETQRKRREAKNGKNTAKAESGLSRESDKPAATKEDTRVRLKPERYKALKELGGSIEELVDRAILVFLQSIGTSTGH